MDWKEFLIEDSALRHAIQTGVAYEQQIDEHAGFYRNNPSIAQILKHIRTGLNCTMCEHSAVIRLLVKKNLVTEQEYFESALEALKEEKEKYERILSRHYGRSITLG